MASFIKAIKFFQVSSTCLMLFCWLIAGAHSDKDDTEGDKRLYYVASVVEYKPEGTPWDSSPSELISKNVQNYKRLMNEASSLNADIIVFPEYGLTTLGIPADRDKAKPYLLRVPGVGQNPCDSHEGSEAIQELSCASKLARLYTIINVGEIRPCDFKGACPSDGVFQYNTNVAFARNGTILAKYEKVNLYFEDRFDKPDSITYATFTTDFGVEFGMFTCFDMMFFNPSIPLVERGIRNFVFPTAWVDELPFLTAIQAQASWSQSVKSNLLASGYHQPLGGQLGSGIYSGMHGALNYTFDPDSGTRLVIARVPIQIQDYSKTVKQSREKLKDYSTDRNPGRLAYHSFLREDLQNYTTKVIIPSSVDASDEVCTEDGFCCKVDYKMAEISSLNSSAENYRLMAFNGTRLVAAKTSQFDWQVCGIIRCLNESLESCSENSKNSSSAELSNYMEIKLSAFFDYSGSVSGPSVSLLDVTLSLMSYDLFDVEVATAPEKYNNSRVQITSSSLQFISVKTIAIINKLF